MEFSLSEEQKRRIEQEEGARIAEETYREQVRRSIASSAAGTRRAEPLSGTPAGITRRGVNWGTVGVAALLLFAVVIGFSVIFYRSQGSGSASDSSSIFSRWSPVTVSLAHGQFQVPPRNYLSWTVDVPATVRNYHVAGHYSVIGGSGNDIQAVIATEDEFQNWINGHQAHVLYSTPDRVTTGAIDLVLPAGRYVLAFNNRFSLLTAKAVSAEIGATYERLN